MKVLLVGATGFVGRHLLAALTTSGHEVVATSRRHHSRDLSDVEWQVLDLDRLASDPNHFVMPQGIDLLINAAGLLSVDREALQRTQDLGTRALFDLAAERQVRVLHISALGAGEQPDVAFLASKAAADNYLMELDVSAVVLRPSLLVGAGGTSSGWLTRLSPWPLIPLFDLDARLQPVHIDDVSGAVLALLRHWPSSARIVPLVGPQALTLAQLLDHLRAAQGWEPARYLRIPPWLAAAGTWCGERLGWKAWNHQCLRMARRDNVADPELLATLCGYRAAPLATHLVDWPNAAQSVQAALRPLMLAVMLLIWFGTAAVCLGPGYDWSLRIMAEFGVTGGAASFAVWLGSLCDALLGLGMLFKRWRRRTFQAQLLLMASYTLIISLVLPHYWFDPYAAVAKNLVLMVATLWLLWTEPRR